MNPVLVSLDQLSLVQIFLSTAALACLCLASERHARQVGHRLNRTALRSVGWIMMAAMTGLVLVAANPYQAIVATLGALSFAILLTVGLLTYRPGWLVGVSIFSALLTCTLPVIAALV